MVGEFAIEENDIEWGCEVGFGSGESKTERRDEVGRECTYEVERGIVWEIVSVGVDTHY